MDENDTRQNNVYEAKTQEEETRPEIENPEPKKGDRPDFIGDDHNACAWVAHYNTEGEIIALNVKIGEFRFKLRKRFF